jgi:hypothetical protein
VIIFPREWDMQVYLHKLIHEACAKPINIIENASGGALIRGTTAENIIVDVTVNKSGKIVNACPVKPDGMKMCTPQELTDMESALKHNLAQGQAATTTAKQTVKRIQNGWSKLDKATFSLDNRLKEWGTSVAALNSKLDRMLLSYHLDPIKIAVIPDSILVEPGVKYLKNNILSLSAPSTQLEGMVIKSIQVDLEHIVGYWSKKKDITGGHWDYKKGLERAGIIKSKIIKYGPAGSYEVEVKLLNRSRLAPKSRFSDDWSIVDICQALKEALVNVTSAQKQFDGSWKLIGLAANCRLPIEIKAIINNGILSIKTFYPKI